MPAGATYEPIATSSPSGTNSVTFNSLGSYTDIRLVGQAITTVAGQGILCRVNGDTGVNYSVTQLRGTGASAVSNRFSNDSMYFGEWNTSGTSTTIPMYGSLDFFSYGGSTKKTVLGMGANDQNGSGAVNRFVWLWNNTAAISSITLSLASGNFSAGTMFTLYGIKAA